MAISAGMEGGLGILVIGRNFSIKCDDLSFSLPVKLLEEAVGYLVAYHFCLLVDYPKQTKFVMSFLERLFGMDASVQSRAVTMLINSLSF